uniref:Lysine-specific metallo-endopeptidase domain-containing protein n=1 Tax=Amphimedon queenslandica TaxID=400682 RepID=A0A1X7U8B0_AMPQE
MKALLCICLLITYLTSALSANVRPISLDMACNKALSAVACTFEFTNNANEDLYLLKRGTPLEGLISRFLTVSVAGSPIEYDGIFAHRIPPTKDEFVLLKAAVLALLVVLPNNKGTLDAHKQLCSGIDRVNITNNDLYKKWFGAFTTTRESKVKAVYKKMRDGLAGNTVTYVNDGSYCEFGWYGYTWRASDRPGLNTVWLCSLFYRFPVSCGSPGTYTKEFGLIHEWSHAFGDTDDHVYGSSESQDLAKTDPDKAVANADSYGWHYCEWQ